MIRVLYLSLSEPKALVVFNLAIYNFSYPNDFKMCHVSQVREYYN